MNEKAADRKIKKLLMFVAVIINSWIPANKRVQYINYLYGWLKDEQFLGPRERNISRI